MQPQQDEMKPKTKLMKKDMIPPDRNQCQAEVPNGNTFMTLGGVPSLVRCSNKATHILKEKVAAKDGLKGSMSVCGRCLTKFIEQRTGDLRRYGIEKL